MWISRQDFRFPSYSPAERRADAIVHALGVAACLAGVTALFVEGESLPPLAWRAAAIYGVGLLATFLLSASYNLARRPHLKARLRRFDHAAIFVMIAGSYTPVAGVFIGGEWGWFLLGLEWGLAAVGATIALFLPRRFERFNYILYFVQGWLILIAIDSLAAAVSGHVLTLILGGSLILTAGALVHRWHSLPYQNAIWHAAVLIGAACHYAAITDALAPLRDTV